jgi:hypothetical protein
VPFCRDKGNPDTAKLWFVVESPYGSDIPQSLLFSGGLGNVWAKMLREAGIDPDACYYTSRCPDTDVKGFVDTVGKLNHYKPPLVCVLGYAADAFLAELKTKDEGKPPMQKWAGSLLTSPQLTYPHYCVPLYDPQACMGDWTERNITTYIDLQKLRDELAHFKKFNTLRPLPERTLIYHDIPFDELISYIERFSNSQFISNDIENPTYKTEIYKPHPGYPFLLGLADSPNFGISFRLFRDSPSENRKLWRSLDSLYKKVTLIGQNFFNYDALFHNALGFNLDLSRVQDTLIRHHILWPELSHKLQFLTRQYTREPYYKDDGHSWTMKSLGKYRRYNAMDACVTYEVWQGQEEEFNDKPHLRS